MKKYIWILLLVVLVGGFLMVQRVPNNSYVETVQEQVQGTWIASDIDLTWTYVSANAAGNTFVISAPGDLTDTYFASLRFRAKQGGGFEHFIIHLVEYDGGTDTTSLTLFGGASGDLISAAITDAAWSPVRFPAGFPVGEDEWGFEVVDTSQRTQASPVSNTYYNPGSTNHQITLSPGVWRIGFDALATITNSSSAASQLYVALSTSPSSVSNLRLVDLQIILGLSGVVTGNGFHAHAEDEITLATETTYYLIAKQESSSTTSLVIGPATTGSEVPTVLYAVSGYY